MNQRTHTLSRLAVGASGLSLLPGCASVVTATDAGPVDRLVLSPDGAVLDVPRDAVVVPLDALPDGTGELPCRRPPDGWDDFIKRVYPRSSSRLTGRRPVFRWRGALAGRLVALEICRDRFCENVIERYFTNEQ
jgi:hypothetical protein